MRSECHNILSNFDSVKNGEGEDWDSGAEGEENSTATLFYDTLKEKTDIGEIAGDIFVIFLDIFSLLMADSDTRNNSTVIWVLQYHSRHTVQPILTLTANSDTGTYTA